MVTLDDVRRLALSLPETEEYVCWGTPAWRVRKKIIARLREDEMSLAIKATEEERLALPASDPDTYSIPQHYANSNMFVVRLDNADADELRELLTEAWRMCAPKRLVAAFDVAH